MRIVGTAYRGGHDPVNSARGWLIPSRACHAIIEFDFGAIVGPVEVIPEADGSLLVAIEVGSAPEPERLERWRQHPKLAVAYVENWDATGPLTLTCVSLVRENVDYRIPDWTLED